MSDRPNFPQIEEQLLENWEKEKIFEQTLAKAAPKGRFVFFEGPPTANGKPGIHHVESRAFKDCLLRFRTMQGYLVDRKAGWDTHGLPVEIEVEKQLGFSGKKDIENFGIEPFNKKCRESVWKYLEDWQKITKRIAFWLDLDKPYVTYHSEYVESLWWIIKQIWDKDLLYQDYKVVPHCPRCVTTLSSHELAQGYKEVDDQSVYIKFKIEGEENSYFLVWTTTPWTLPSNVALAIGENISYSQIKLANGEKFILASGLLGKVSESFETVWEKNGSELVGMKYVPLYETYYDTPGREKEKAYKVYTADFVSTTDGSGIVHIAPAYGEDDSRLGDAEKLPVIFTVDQTGMVSSEKSPGFGKFMKKADEDIKKDLLDRGLLYKEETYRHTYPFCWRCKAPLLYLAKFSWYIKMSSLRDKLIEGNENIHWEPDYIKEGRFGEWLREVKDWAFSRERYWGTPLPIWTCSCGQKTCIGSFEELKAKAVTPMAEPFDPHRPFVDDVLIKCDSCGEQMKRIPEVCDVWFDSGCMPFAQWHYPFENKEKIDPTSPGSEGQATAYPADYISEAIDQTRGWFYTLLAVATLLGKERPYKNVICLGHVLDAQGKKMSKSIGNVVDPVETINKYGADSVRWYMYSINQPGDSKRFDLKSLDEMIKKVFMILWNIMTFYELYEGKEREIKGEKEKENVLDRWVLSRLNQLIKDSTEQLENYKVTEPVRAIADFINDLSTWFVRRSRDRFKGSDEADKAAAIFTLRECLLGITKLMAPFTPFLSDAIYLRLQGGKASVHLDDWPTADVALIDEKLLERMARARSVVSKILEARAETGRPVRQPLASATVWLPEGELDAELIEIIKDEVNVKAVIVEKGEYNVELDVNLTPELLREGMARDLVRRINEMRKNNKLTIEDRIEIYFESAEVEAQKMIEEYGETIRVGTLANNLRTTGERPEICEAFRLNECDITVGFIKV
ncbi:MAG: isoleucine--tRNA ligase [Patescibacteria group bacterium]|jgi:isoleucyl-tRNA synthetase